jgi:hypothetical protein
VPHFRLHKKFLTNVTLVWRDVVTLLETGELQMDYIPSRVFAELREQFNQARLLRKDNCERNDEYMIEWIQTCRLWSWWVDRQLIIINHLIIIVCWINGWLSEEGFGSICTQEATHSLPVFVCLEGNDWSISSLVGNWAILDIDWLISKYCCSKLRGLSCLPIIDDFHTCLLL